MATLHFKFGAMNAGKTTQLIQAAFNYNERNLCPLILKPKIDTRSAPGIISARIGLTHECIDFTPEDCISEIVRVATVAKPIAVVLIDEAQFMTESQAMELVVITKEFNIPVVCYGLKNDFSGNLFEGSAKILAIADKLEVLKTVCWCGDGATQNARIDSDGNMVTVGNSIEVGDVGRYVPLCMEHYAQHRPTPEHAADYKQYHRMIGKVYGQRINSEVNDDSDTTMAADTGRVAESEAD